MLCGLERLWKKGMKIFNRTIPARGDVPCVIKWNVFGEVKWNEVSDKMKYNHLAINILIFFIDLTLIYFIGWILHVRLSRNFARKPNEDFPKLIKVFLVFLRCLNDWWNLVFWVKIYHEVMNILRLRFSHDQFRVGALNWTVM